MVWATTRATWSSCDSGTKSTSRQRRGGTADAIHHRRHARRAGPAGIERALAVERAWILAVDCGMRLGEQPDAAMIGLDQSRPHMPALLDNNLIRRHVADRLAHFLGRRGRIVSRQQAAIDPHTGDFGQGVRGERLERELIGNDVPAAEMGMGSREFHALQPAHHLVGAVDGAEAGPRHARMYRLAAQRDVDIDPAAIAERDSLSGRGEQQREIGFDLERAEDRLGAQMAAAALVVDGQVERARERHALLVQQLEDRQHDGTGATCF